MSVSERSIGVSQVFALPGMGADGRMYGKEWNAIPALRRISWPYDSRPSSLAELGEIVVRREGIRDGAFLIGSSLGGMVAGEISKKTQLAGICLIGSAIQRQEVNGLLRLFSPLAKVLPFEMLRVSAGKIPHELMEMFSEADGEFTRSAISALMNWEGAESVPCRRTRIHGKFDPIIPLPQIVDLTIDCGHLPAMSAPVECANHCLEFIKRA